MERNMSGEPAAAKENFMQSFRTLVLSTSAAFATLFLVAGGPAAQSAPGFHYANVDIGIPWDFISCEYDDQGRFHVAYYAEYDLKLGYAILERDGWTTMRPDQSSDDNGIKPELAVDGSGRPHIIYWVRDPANEVRYAHQGIEGAWTIEVVPLPGPAYVLDHDLAVDRDGNPHISFRNSDLDELVHITRTDGGPWVTTTVDTAGIAGVGNAIAIDSQGHPRIAYREDDSPKLKYAAFNGSEWEILSHSASPDKIDLALGPADEPHISYYSGGSADRPYHAWVEFGYIFSEVVDYSGGGEWSTSIAVDQDGQPHLVYGTPAAELMYARKNGTTWETTTVDDERFTLGVAVDLDSRGKPHIGYHSPDNIIGYASSSFDILSPRDGDLWVAGAEQRLRWRGAGPVDVLLSIDGGLTYELLRASAELHDLTLHVPAVRTEAAVLKIVRQSPYDETVSTGSFSIQLPGESPKVARRLQRTMTGEESGDQLGGALCPARDFNADGHPDLLVGAPNADVSASSEGKAYVFYGGPGWDDTADLVFSGDADDDRLGFSVDYADMNGDQIADAVVGIIRSDDIGDDAGKVEVYFGGDSPDATQDRVFFGEAAGDNFGRTVASAGDVNGDGFEDIIVGAIYADAGGNSRGRAYVFYGAWYSDTTPDLVFSGEQDYQRFGYSVTGAGDLNADGYDDVAVGTQDSPGKVYVYFGGPSADEIPDVVMQEEALNDRFGRSLAGGSDINGDGHPDLLTGAAGNDDGGSGAGKVYAYIGGP
ncbi:MAG: hypothetical protein GF355_02600, partial [Candidatus Eisenbacteria bacterium]|nr:hypothetical protein [Candidatus Eisenbacteria bacterium]